MYPKESAFERQVFVGPFLGPFLALLTMAVALFYYSPYQMELPLAGLISIYCSWKWNIRGMLIAWILLAAVVSYKVFSAEGTVVWNILLGISIALASLVTALTQKNVREHLEWKYQDFIEQQGRLAIVEAQLNSVLITVQQERNNANQIIDNLNLELKEKLEKQEVYDEYMQVARNELNHTRSENEVLHNSINDIRQKAIAYQEQWEKANEKLNDYRLNENKYFKQEEDLKDLRHGLNAYEHQIASYREDLSRYKHQQSLINEMGEMINTLTREKGLLENALLQLQTELEEVNQRASTQEVEVNEHSSSELRRLEGFYRQLREQFEEKSRTLDAARQELFITKEKLCAIEKEIHEKELGSPRISIEEHIKQLAHAEEEFKNELDINKQEIQKLYYFIDSVLQK